MCRRGTQLRRHNKLNSAVNGATTRTLEPITRFPPRPCTLFERAVPVARERHGFRGRAMPLIYEFAELQKRQRGAALSPTSLLRCYSLKSGHSRHRTHRNKTPAVHTEHEDLTRHGVLDIQESAVIRKGRVNRGAAWIRRDSLQ